MARAARLAWILLGLLAVLGAIHGPMHGNDAPCSPAALCSGGVALASVAVVAPALLVTRAALGPTLVVERLDCHPVYLVERGRAPPRG